MQSHLLIAGFLMKMIHFNIDVIQFSVHVFCICIRQGQIHPQNLRLLGPKTYPKVASTNGIIRSQGLSEHSIHRFHSLAITIARLTLLVDIYLQVQYISSRQCCEAEDTDGPLHTHIPPMHQLQNAIVSMSQISLLSFYSTVWFLSPFVFSLTIFQCFIRASCFLAPDNYRVPRRIVVLATFINKGQVMIMNAYLKSHICELTSGSRLATSF